MYKRGKTAYLTITMSVDEYKEIQELSKELGISKARVIMDAFRGKKLTTPEDREQIKIFIRELHRIGVNLNQLVRILHTQKADWQLEEEIREIAGQLKTDLEKIKGIFSL